MGGRTTRLRTQGRRWSISFASRILRRVTGLTIWRFRLLPSTTVSLERAEHGDCRRLWREFEKLCKTVLSFVTQKKAKHPETILPFLTLFFNLFTHFIRPLMTFSSHATKFFNFFFQTRLSIDSRLILKCQQFAYGFPSPLPSPTQRLFIAMQYRNYNSGA